MSDPTLKEVDVAEWVNKAKADTVTYQQRQTVEITLNAIAMIPPLQAQLYLKGGTLMGLAYDSPRHTTDIDLTTTLAAGSDVADRVRSQLDLTFPRVAAALGYADLVVKTHSVTTWPKKNFPAGATWPALTLKIGSAKRGTAQERALQTGQASVVIGADISFNEPLLHIQVLELTGGQELLAYGLVDLMAEKYRAILEQVTRNRYRRQDVYDLDWLIVRNEIDDGVQEQILAALRAKCQEHQIVPTRDSLDNPEIKKRAGAYWQTMEQELEEVPDFEGCFTRVSEFYRNLPWPDPSLEPSPEPCPSP